MARRKKRTIIINRWSQIRLALYILVFICIVIVGLSPKAAEGLECLVLLPFSFCIALLLFQREISYAFESFGLLILFALIVLRYVVSPTLIALSGSLVKDVSTSPAGLRYAIFIMIIELYTIMLAIHFIWKHPKNDGNQAELIHNTEFKITWVGALTCLLLAAVVLYRGRLPSVIEHLSFGSSFRIATTDVQTYDTNAVLVLKVFLFLAIVSWASRKYAISKYRSLKAFYFVIALFAAMVNTLIYDATNRATTVMFGMASISVLLYCFGKKMKRLVPLLAIAGFIFVWSMFAYGTLGESSGVDFFSLNDSLQELSRVSELYSNGVSMEAHAYDMYDQIISRVNFETYMSELIKSNNIFTLPGLWVVGRWVKAVPSFQSLFNNTLHGYAFILPNSGLAMYSASFYLSIPADIVFHILIISMLYRFYCKRKNSADIAYNYLYSYCEMICGFALINNLMIAVSLLSALPFLLFLLLKINCLGRKK